MAAIRVPRSGPGRVTSANTESALSSPSPPARSATVCGEARAEGRPPAFDAEAYKQRNSVERCINRLKQWRGLAMRTDKLAIAYQAALHLAAILIWARR